MKNLITVLATLICAAAANAQQRVVLAELFSNSSCPPCATNTPQVTQYVENNPATSIAVVYHTNFPYNSDSMYHENPVESNARVVYYGISYAPSTVADGNVFNGPTPTFLSNMSTTMSNRAAVAPQYSINPVYAELDGNTLNVSFEFMSLGNYVADSLRAHIVVVEQTVLKSSYAASPGNNSETEYHYVMRKMLPNPNGTYLLNRSTNEKDTVSLSWNLQHIKSIDEIRVVSFVQNANSKEVYQAAHTTPEIVTSVEHISPQENSFSVYPNPASTHLTLQSMVNGQCLMFSVYNTTGQLVLQSKIINHALPAGRQESLINVSSLPSGIYYVTLESESARATQKIIIQQQ